MKQYREEQSNIRTKNIGENTIIHSHVWIGEKVIIGDYCKIQAFTFIPDGITIGNNVFIGPHVVFCNDKNPPSYGKGWQETIIKDDVSIGANATILPGLILKKGCMIGAGSVVTKNIGLNEIWWGNPAKVY